MLLKDYYSEDDDIDQTETDNNDVLKPIKMGSLFQITLL